VLQRILEAGTEGRWLIFPKKIRALIIPRKNETQALFFYHLSLFAKNFTNLGRGIDVTGWHPADSQSSEEPKTSVLDGYDPSRKQMSIQESKAYEVELANALNGAEPRFVSIQTEDACRHSAEVIRKLGAIPVFLVTPVARQWQFRFHRAPGAILSFNDARTYPSFYRTEMRSDTNHLNIRGAEEFSSVIAQKCARLVKENQIK
jgi:hypothetical protein